MILISEEDRAREELIQDLTIRLHRLSGILYGDLMYSYDDIQEMRNLCNTEKTLSDLTNGE